MPDADDSVHRHGVANQIHAIACPAAPQLLGPGEQRALLHPCRYIDTSNSMGLEAAGERQFSISVCHNNVTPGWIQGDRAPIHFPD